MEANDLRLNNWILDHENTPRKVAYIGETIGLHNESGGTQKYQHNPIISGDINDLKPIELTPELLGKAGLEKVNDSVTEYENVEHGATVYTFKNGFEFYLDTWHSGVWIKHLHQLQNLYYALTGEELNINL
jgi:hypothetical protein